MSTSAAASSLVLASQQVVIYGGFFIFIAGLIGGPLVLLVFLSLRTFRESSCAFYLTIMSIVNFFHLFTGLLTYIMINGFDTNWTNTSLFYCKFRQFNVQFCVTMSLTCMCLATIDQFLATCSHPRWHQWNNIKFASRIVIGASIVWVLHGIPFILYSNHAVSPTTGALSCSITNAIFQKYYIAFYYPVLVSSLPVAIMTLFGILAYRNVRQIAHRTVPLVRRELDKQLTVMVLVQVFYDVIVVVPVSVQTFYFLIIGTSSDLFTMAQQNSIKNITNILYYFRFVGPLYIYVCVSKRFRQQLIYVLCTVHLNRWRGRGINNNQVEPQT